MSVLRLARSCAVLAILATGGLPEGAGAQTLTQTLINTYQQSPVLDAQRAALRASDEGVASARSAMRPNITASSTSQVSATDTNDFDPRFSLSGQLTTSLLLFDSGQTRAAIEAAKSRVAANRGILRNVEQNVLLSAVAAFMDVRRDGQQVQVSRNNVAVLRQEVQATRDRFELGEVTRTDVSLAEARLASANATLTAVQGNLTASREAYRAIVGAAPRSLSSPPGLPQLPASLAEVEAVAIERHPSLIAARYLQTAAEFDLDRARALRGLTLNMNTSAGFQNSENLFGQRNTVASIGAGITGSIPLYRGGQLSSAIRQAIAILDRSKFDVQDVARQIRQNAAVAWSNLAVARATITANKEEVRAARIAFEGVREEARLGARTTLDVLDLEQQLRSAEFQLASSLRDEYVAAYQLLSAMGLLSVEHLKLGIPTYDPDVNYNNVQNAPLAVEFEIMDQLRDRYAN